MSDKNKDKQGAEFENQEPEVENTGAGADGQKPEVENTDAGADGQEFGGIAEEGVATDLDMMDGGDGTLPPAQGSQAAHFRAYATRDESNRYHLTGMYQNWFIDYASYVILERAVPDLYDGLKPVQRRILHAMSRVEDGRYNKVANIVGQAMQFHPHGDASIKDALVGLGQKELLIDCQGNWGDISTGADAAAARYIEARLSKFALEAVFNPKTTHWKLSYDGRNKEPINLPIKFPLLLAQGVEGIAVGLNSLILPHNFNELCDASVAYLRGEDFTLYPDFLTGGVVDVSRYNDGQRGGVVKVRSKISKVDNKTLSIQEVPYGTTVRKIIETIIKANERGKIKIRKIDDLSADKAEILVHLQPNVSSDKTIDALYAFTDCEVSISPNCCVIKDKRPIFTNISELLKISTDHTRQLLQWELEIQKSELQEKLLFISLERLFIEQRIYKDKEFEDSRSPQEAIRHIDKRIEPFKKDFYRPITDDDLLKLLEIKMSRITRYDSKKAEEQIVALNKKLKQTEKDLAHIVDYTIAWFENLKQKYGEQHPRRTEIRNFETIVATKVAEANQRLYVDYEGRFVGTGLKKDTFVSNCSDLDDVIVIFRDGKYKIVHVADKVSVVNDKPSQSNEILHVAVFKKADTRTIYNIVYRDGKNGPYYMKRCAITGLTRDKEYDLTRGTAGSKIVYFTANPNGEAEVIRTLLKPAFKLKKLEIITDLSTLAVKGKQSMGNLLTKYDVKQITLKQKGGSTLGGLEVWYDPDVRRLNYDGRGQYLGEFHNEDSILVIMNNGDCIFSNFDITNHYDDGILVIEKYRANKVWTAALWDADQGYYYGKRFTIDKSNKPQNLLGENKDSRLVVINSRMHPLLQITFADSDAWRQPEEVDMNLFIAVKSLKAKGKRLTTYKVEKITDISPEDPEEIEIPNTTDGFDGAEDGQNDINVDDIPMDITVALPDEPKDPDDPQMSLF